MLCVQKKLSPGSLVAEALDFKMMFQNFERDSLACENFQFRICKLLQNLYEK